MSDVTVYENVAFKEWNTRNGHLELSQSGIMYQASTSDDSLKMNIAWSQLKGGPMLNQASAASGRHLLKLHVEGDSFVFQLPSRETAEQLKQEIVMRLKAFKSVSSKDKGQPEIARVASSTEESETENVGAVQYAPVTYREHDGGVLRLTSQGMNYFNSDGVGCLRLDWGSVAKHKINSASQEKDLLRIVDSKHFSHIFQMENRMVLEDIRDDIKGRRQAARRQAADRMQQDVAKPNLEGWFEGQERNPAGLNIKVPDAETAKKRHGENRQKYDEEKQTLGSFKTPVGPAADVRELEYISALHQNAEFLLRSDGTICSDDIVPYLLSRYGLKISQEQAVDIALGLCGAKTRNEFSAERDAIAQSSHHPDLTAEADDIDEGEDDDDEEEKYYFDLVQVMSLLVIPELLQLSDQYKIKASLGNDNLFDVSEPVSFISADDDKELAPSATAVVQVAIESLLETFDEELRKDIREGRRPLDAELLGKILESSGDVDGASNRELIQQMLASLNPESPSLTAENLIRALTSDCRSYSSPENEGNKKGTATSTFYDCFGFNFDTKCEDEEKEASVHLVKTATFIDYAADTYRSVVHNTSVWCLFILTTLIYLNFFRSQIKKTWGQPVCKEDKFGCEMGNKIVEWLINAIFCGFYGVCFILPTSVGNVPGRKVALLFTLVVTALLTYAPFSTLIWYKAGIPYNVSIDHEFRIVCPSWINASEAEEEFNDTKTDTTQFYLRLDTACHSAVEWCEEHPEVQGKYLDEKPSILSYDEFEKCYDFLSGTVLSDFDSFWETTGGPCDHTDFTTFCPAYGACARRDLTEDAPYICCHTGQSVFYDAGNVTFDEVCDNQPPGAPCTADDMCESLSCTSNVCDSEPDTTEAQLKKQLGEACERSNEMCKSGFCWEGKCQLQPQICPFEELEPFGGWRLDPFCRTVDDWCTINDVDTLEEGLSFVGLEIDPSLNDTCAGVIKLFSEVGLVNVIDPSKAKIGYTTEIEKLNPVEEVLLDDWAYFVLLCIPICGFFALAAICRGLLFIQTDARPRDYKIKCSASFKIRHLIENALSMHPVVASSKGQVMRNFFLDGEEFVEVGGLFYTLRGLVSGALFSKEGIRFSGRIFVGQVVQGIVTVIGVAYAVEFVKLWADEVDEVRQDLDNTYTQAEVQQISNYEWATYTQDDLRTSVQEQRLLDRWPEKWMVEAAGFPAVAFGTLVALFCMVVYLPSYTGTVIKLRSGAIPTLHDPLFFTFRNAADNVVQNIGNMVFSLMGAAVFSAALVFGLIFVFLWPETRKRALGFLAVAIGIIVTIVVKVVGQRLLRARNFSSFYRKKPAGANAANLFFEAWYIGTGLLVVVSRLIIFLVTAAFYLGRIDCQFFHPQVRILGRNLDKIPEAFRRDMLVHEAHLHPYIERLGSMYLHRIRDGTNFGSPAGTAWRCLFVSGLMPWIVKHRVNTNDVNLGASNDL